MITGFNTDIQYDGVTYHVQTEDKGVAIPIVMSLVYHRGTILASKRSPYKDLLESELDEDVLAERLKRQHNLICAAIQAGRIEDLKRMSMNDPSVLKEGLVVKRETKKTSKKKDLKSTDSKSTTQKERKSSSDTAESKIKKPANIKKTKAKSKSKEVVKDKPEKVWDIAILNDADIIEEEDFYEEEIVLPPGAVKIVSDFTTIEEAVSDELKVKIVRDYKFKSGTKKNIGLLVYRGKEQNIIKEVNIMVKVLGEAFRPQIFHSKTNDSGIANIELKLPSFSSGRAAVLVRASINGEETSIRRAIKLK